MLVWSHLKSVVLGLSSNDKNVINKVRIQQPPTYHELGRFRRINHHRNYLLLYISHRVYWVTFAIG